MDYNMLDCVENFPFEKIVEAVEIKSSLSYFFLKQNKYSSFSKCGEQLSMLKNLIVLIKTDCMVC